MRRIELRRPAGVRWLPGSARGAGVLVLAGASGRVDEPRARLLAEQSCIAASCTRSTSPPAGPRTGCQRPP